MICIGSVGRGSSDLSRKLQRGCATTDDIEVQSNRTQLNGECAVSFVRNHTNISTFYCQRSVEKILCTFKRLLMEGLKTFCYIHMKRPDIAMHI